MRAPSAFATIETEQIQQVDRIVAVLEQKLAAEDAHEVLLSRGAGVTTSEGARDIVRPSARVWREVVSRARNAGWEASFDGETLRVRFPS